MVSTAQADAPAEAPGRRAFNRIPGATYRLQFNADFTLDHARDLLDYLQDLGVTDVYASPLFQAAPDSTHGYDTCCHGRIAETIGGIRAFEQFSAELRERGMGLLVDIVPNHMSAHASNAWWWDVLKHGRLSRFAHYFDIEWHSPHGLTGKVLLPVLGAPLSEGIEKGDLKVRADAGEWMLTYHGARFPVNPATPLELLQPPSKESSALTEGDRLLTILDLQHYRLAYWREGLEKINYRRFFDVTSLVALRMEDEEVFRATHETVFEWIEKGLVTGLRVDHPDGLRDPRQYFDRLQQRFAATSGGEKQLYVVSEKILSGEEQLPADWPVAGTTGYDFLNQVSGLFVASRNERAMTNIYVEFAGSDADFHEIAYSSKKRVLDLLFRAEVNALAARAHALGELGGVGEFPFEELRSAIIEVIACFPTYRTYLAEGATDLSESDCSVISRAVEKAVLKRSGVADAIRFVASLMLGANIPPARERDAREFVLRFQQLTGPAAAKGIEDTAFYNYHRLVSLNEVGGDPAEFGITLEQFHEENQTRAQHWPHSLLATSTHDTKRGEDARARINVLSEVPEDWRHSVSRWRHLNERHKTIVAGASAPDANDEYLFYQTLVGAWPVDLWQTKNQSKSEDDVQTLSRFRERIVAYLLKAIKEAKRHTSWTDSNEAYESATRRFVEGALTESNQEFLAEFTQFQRTTTFFGAIHSLSQTLLKLTSPGIPDIYQGSEFCDLSLVDPDNRRPVDYPQHRRRLGRLKLRQAGNGDTEFRTDDLISGGWKMLALSRVLEFRRAHRELFENGNYLAVTAKGARLDHVCAFARSWQGDTLVVVCPRLVHTLTNGTMTLPCGPEIWGDDTLDLSGVPAANLRNVLTGQHLAVGPEGRLPMAQVLTAFPVALLATE